MSAAAIRAGTAWSLRHYARSAALIAAVLGLTLIAALPSRLVGPGLGLTALPDDGWGIAWTSLAAGPNVARQQALAALVSVLIVSATIVAAVGVLSLVALAVARGAQRRAEVVIRRAAGASRRVLWWTALAEGAVLAFLGGTAGTAGVLLIVHEQVRSWPETVAAAITLGFAVVALILVAVAVWGALLPLGFARSRAPGVDTSAAPVPLFVPALQLGLSLLAVIASAQLARGAAGPPPSADARGDGYVVQLHGSSETRDLLTALRVDHAVTLASLASPGTHLGLGTVDYVTTECGRCFNGGLPAPLHVVRATTHVASADTFLALGLPMVAGRGLTDADQAGAARVAVISRSLAERDFEGGNALGRRVRVGPPGSWYDVVGIVEDGRVAAIGGTVQPPHRVYLSVWQHPAAARELLVRARPGSGVPERIAAIGTSQRERDLMRREHAMAGWFASALRWQGVLGLGIALLGLCAVMLLWVQRVMPELAVRRAVGARRRHVLGFLLARGALVTAGGAAIAWWLEPLLSDLVRAAVPGVPAAGVSLVPGPLVLLLLAALLAALIPGWRAARAAPATLPGLSEL